MSDIKYIFFDWYGVNEDNPESFGQITIVDADDEKLGVINLDFKYEDLFLLVFSLMKGYGDKHIQYIYEKVMGFEEY